MKTKMRILLVDDDIDIITVLETILRREGYDVLSASNKADGFKLVKSWKPDLAILDVMMDAPYDGFELAKMIRDDHSTARLPLIIHTSMDVLFATRPGIQEMAREFRKDPNYSNLEVILLKNIESNDAGVDYITQKGENVFFNVNGFIRKPVNAEKLLPEVKRILMSN